MPALTIGAAARGSLATPEAIDVCNEVVLTFDDGPHLEHTPRILDVLAEHKIQAVFFVCGEQLVRSGGLDIVRRAAREGHLIGNHSFNHIDLRSVSAAEIRAQITLTHELIAECEPNQKLFRPPYGYYDRIVEDVVSDLGYDLVLWNVDPSDWAVANKPSKWIDLALDQIKDGRTYCVCVCHDLQASTAEHLSAFIQTVGRRRNARFGRYDFARPVQSYASLSLLLAHRIFSSRK